MCDDKDWTILSFYAIIVVEQILYKATGKVSDYNEKKVIANLI